MRNKLRKKAWLYAVKYVFPNDMVIGTKRKDKSKLGDQHGKDVKE